MWFAVDTEIYPLKMASEWKYALEKSLIDAAKFPLPMEVFKVRWEFIAIHLLLFKNKCGAGEGGEGEFPISNHFPLFKKLPSWPVSILNVLLCFVIFTKTHITR